MDNSRNKQIENLGVNKMGKHIKNTHLHHLNYDIRSYEPEPVVYDTSKEDFKSVVQQLTGSPNHPPHKPPNNTQKPKITKLQTFRPPPLSLVQPAFPVQVQVPSQISFAIPAAVQLSFPDPIPIPRESKAPPLGVKIINLPRLSDGLKETSPILALQPSTVAPQSSTIALPWDILSADMVESPISACVRDLLEDADWTTNATTNSLMDITFPSPQSPYGPLFPTDIHLPSPPSPPLFPPDFQFSSPQSPHEPLLPPDTLPQ